MADHGPAQPLEEDPSRGWDLEHSDQWHARPVSGRRYGLSIDSISSRISSSLPM